MHLYTKLLRKPGERRSGLGKVRDIVDETFPHNPDDGFIGRRARLTRISFDIDRVILDKYAVADFQGTSAASAVACAGNLSRPGRSSL